MTSAFPAEVTALGGGALEEEEEEQRPKGHPGLWALTFAAEAQRSSGMQLQETPRTAWTRWTV